MGHFQGALTKRKEMKLSLQIRDIDWIQTSGELGALILESRLIKERMPSLNIKLRRSKDLCGWSLVENDVGVHTPILVTHHQLAPGLQDNLYGLFYSKREAHSYLKAIAKKHHICEALLGLEKRVEGKSCFGYQPGNGQRFGLSSQRAWESLRRQHCLAWQIRNWIICRRAKGNVIH
jgi:DNA polymerase-3 subunit epsilon